MTATKQFKPKRKDMFFLPIDLIEVDKEFNPRQDYGDIEALAKSIYENGIKMPLRGFKNDRKGSDGRYLLTDGFRRIEAVKLLIKKYPNIEVKDNIPFIIDKSEKSPEQRIIDVMICNDGKKLNPLEEAEVVNRLINFGMSEKDIVKRTGKSGTYISNLKLLYLAPQKIKNLIIDNTLSATLAMDELRNTETYEEAVKNIEKAVAAVKKQGKSKVRKTDLVKSKGSINSVSQLKKCFKIGTREERVVKQDKQELYDFATKILNGEYTKEELAEMFYEPIAE